MSLSRMVSHRVKSMLAWVIAIVIMALLALGAYVALNEVVLSAGGGVWI